MDLRLHRIVGWSVGETLATAQVLEARERDTCRPPFSDAEYWAAFVVIGDA